MATLTIRIPDDKHLRLKALAQHRHVSVNKLVEELSTQALVKPIRRSAVKLSRRVHHGLLKWGVSLQKTEKTMFHSPSIHFAQTQEARCSPLSSTSELYIVRNYT